MLWISDNFMRAQPGRNRSTASVLTSVSKGMDYAIALGYPDSSLSIPFYGFAESG